MAKTSQEFIPVDEIRDGVVILKNGELRSVLMVSSINFDLKNENEKEAIIAQYQDFLNSLDFSIQIFVQSRNFDVRPYLAILEKRAREEMNELMKIQIREYMQFIRSFTENTNIMAKSFYVVIPYAPALFETKKGLLGGLFGGSKGTTSKVNLEHFEENRSQIEQREAIVAQGLERMGLRTLKLGTEELVELFYKLFNPGDLAAPNIQQQ